jgi:hypothetical protein
MNIMKLKIATPEYVAYLYIPEGEGTPGEIQMNIDGETAQIVTRASNDNSAEHYGYKAAKAVKERVEKKIFPLQFTNAWG